MIARKYDYDPSDISTSTIEKLFYKQIRSLTMKTVDVDSRMKTFDLQFSDYWI